MTRHQLREQTFLMLFGAGFHDSAGKEHLRRLDEGFRIQPAGNIRILGLRGAEAGTDSRGRSGWSRGPSARQRGGSVSYRRRHGNW